MMQVHELLEKLRELPPEMEVYMCKNVPMLFEMDDVHEESHTIGLATKSPTTRQIVVLDTDTCEGH